MEFRRLTSSDLTSLLDLYKQLDADNNECSAVQSCYAVYLPNLTRGNRGICFIENVSTDKDYRKRGLASGVIDMAIAFAKDHHCYKVILQSGMARTEAHQFYKSKGFNGDSKKAFDMRLE